MVEPLGGALTRSATIPLDEFLRQTADTYQIGIDRKFITSHQ